MVKWWFHRYVLNGSLRREGALLRIEHADGAIGYADLHPWASFGDLALDEELATLASDRPSRLGRRALAHARRDATARAEGRSLWSGIEVPPSHWLLPSLSAPLPDADALAAQGYRRLKVKLGADLPSELPRLIELMRALPVAMKARLDFNERLDASAFSRFLEATADWHPRIDFIEDPTPLPAEWKEARRDFQVALAADKHAMSAEAEVLVLKPAIHDVLRLAREREGFSRRFVVTSYLDHPLGQAAAAVAAGELARQFPGRVSEGGLLSHEVYEPNAFRIRRQGPWFLAPAGSGYGFDEQLAQVDWRRA